MSAADHDSASAGAEQPRAGAELPARYGRWALVTGASAGIGREFARRLASAGLDVVLVARREPVLAELARELSDRYGVRTRVLARDLAAPDAAAVLAAAVADLEIGLLVNNAGTGWIGRFELQAAADLGRLVTLHCKLPVELTSLLLAPMRRRGRGAIILVASAGAYVPMPYYAVYGGTKAFLAMWGEALAAELEGSGIDLLVLSPGDTKTEFQAVAGEQSTRWSSVEDVVAAALGSLGKRTTVIPGLENKIGILLCRFLPRRLVVKIVKDRQRAQTPAERR